MTQQQALAIMKTGVNIYLTGQAGSGKTYVLNQYIRYLREHDISVAITASTGIAATHMNGMTVHAFSGIGIRDSLSEYDLDTILQKSYLASRFSKARVLIIDEVSMLSARTFDMIDRVARAFKGNSQPFGGMQVILSGDFFQLPPIVRRAVLSSEDMSQDDSEVSQASKDMIMYSDAWKSMKPAICYLSEQHRQNDTLLLNILNGIRANAITDTHLGHITGRLDADFKNIEPTKLYTHNVDVDAINHAELAKLSGKQQSYEMSHKGRDVLVESLKKSCLAPETLVLKEGAKVLFIKNNPEKGYANGTRGVVSGFLANKTPVVMLADGRKIEVSPESWRIEDDGKVKAELSQLPLRLAWAITIHKSQGMSLDAAEIDLSKTFAHGMGYVALSRVRTLAGIRLVGFHPRSLSVDPNILTFDETLQIESEDNEKLFGKLSPAEQQKLEEDFIIRAGGSIKKVKLGSAGTKEKIPTTVLTKALIEEGKTIPEIAQIRGFGEGTIIDHIEKLMAAGEEINIEYLKPKTEHIKLVAKHIAKSEGKLSPIKSALDKAGTPLSFDEIRLARLFVDKS